MLRRARFLVLAVLVLAAAPATAAGTPASAADAVRLYDAGAYPEAREVLERLNREGKLDGPLLYRLAFARAKTGDAAGAEQAETAALVALETAWKEAPDLETGFYLSNVYRNRRRAADARAVAAAATARVERGEWPEPEDGLARFRVAKLYEDQSRRDGAERWYRAAVETLAREPDRFPAYLRWAHRYLGDVEFARGEFDAASSDYAAMLADTPGTPDGWDRLGTSLARLGKFGEAADAWRSAEKLDPANGDRYRYCWRLARQAGDIGKLPVAAPDGRAIATLSKEDLEALMKDRAGVPERAAAGTVGTAELAGARATFLAAALEYAMRNYPIRETAFFGGYAPLIFHPDRWIEPE